MKIKITETQAKRLKLITEDVNPLTQFEQLCRVRVQEVDKLFGRVIGLSISEILHNEIKMEEINSTLERIEHEIHVGGTKAYAFIKNLPEEDLDVRIDRAGDTVNSKVTSLQLVVMDLEKLQLSVEQHNLMAPFSDVKPIDISDIQS